jgi:CRP-like cAMP-binding protein
LKPGTEALKALPIVGALADDALAALNETADLARVGPEETLISAGDVLDELTFLIAGKAAATCQGRRGDSAPIDVLLPIKPLCLAGVLLERPVPHGVLTLTAARLIVLPLSDLRRQIETSPSVSAALLDYALAESYRVSWEVGSLKLRSSAQRLAEYLLSRASETEVGPARFVLPFEKRLLAASIGCSQENLSRAFAALRRVGVESRHGVVVIRDVTTLRTYVAAAPNGP